ncbi:HD domain-containing phosphohydrolase [Quisquiliibacterium transsilvanicum]|uniref:Putative nucleotidyltransferase with HDIG domain n=1 Tax=Quisquiliibacterium transsilvanicum TaxID=1549638 RepID=A0A7W8HHN4_9BURK|nr:HD domain-containing phosphohydrolase [Quisquiliibacterium transsilvanicum]MBB5271478.1 putative nucleotidyltransferase with HDIG domain [Quisquiliibacterium transsilvanicum]
MAGFSLRARLQLLLVLVLVVLSSLMAWHLVLDGRGREARVKAELLATARLLAAQQREIAAHADATLLGLAQSAQLFERAVSDCESAMTRLARSDARYVNAGFVRPDGRPFCSATGSATSIDFSDRKWFQAALASQDMVVSDVLLGRILDVQLISFARALRNSDGEATGIVFLALDLSWLSSGLASGAPLGDTRIVMLDSNGVVVGRFPDAEGFVGGAASTDMIAAVGSEAEGLWEMSGVDGRLRIHAFTPLIETVSGRMTLWVNTPVESLQGKLLDELRLGLLLAVSVLMLVVAAAHWGSDRFLLRPLARLSDSAQRFGGGDRAARSGLPHGKDEIGVLARALDEAADSASAAEVRLARINRSLKMLGACKREVAKAVDEERLLEAVCRIVVEIGGYRMAWVGYAEQDFERSVRPRAWAGADEGYLEQALVRWDSSERAEGPIGRAIRIGTYQVTDDVKTDPKFAPWRDLAIQRGYGSVLAHPLWVSGKVIGMLGVYADRAGAFQGEEVDLLVELAGDLSTGIAAIRVRAERDSIAHRYAHHAEVLQESLEQSIQAIAATLEARDPYTAGHQRRVADLAVAIARDLGLDEDRIHGLRLAGILHDLGKIQVPSEILTMPRRLTEAEYALVKQHPQAGYEILKGIDFPWPIAEIVLQHHEKFDGSGYPRGLRGDDILPEARIMLVADVIEAMASHRPYRPALGVDAALAEIERGRGTAYETRVVDSCLKLFREGRFTLDSAG